MSMPRIEHKSVEQLFFIEIVSDRNRYEACQIHGESVNSPFSFKSHTSAVVHVRILDLYRYLYSDISVILVNDALPVQLSLYIFLSR